MPKKRYKQTKEHIRNAHKALTKEKIPFVLSRIMDKWKKNKIF